MSRPVRDKLARARLRPDPAQWGDDEAMTLIEAIFVFFPQGPLTLCSLRTAISKGQLEFARVAGKDLTTPAAIRKLLKPCRAAKPNRPAFGTDPTPASGSSSTESGKSAQAAAAQTLRAQRRRSKAISQSGTSPRLGRPILVSSQ